MLTDVPADAKVSADEAFSPVVVVSSFDDEDEAFDQVNSSPLRAAGHDLQTAFRAHRDLDVGGVVVGREGLRYAMGHYTYECVHVLDGTNHPVVH